MTLTADDCGRLSRVRARYTIHSSPADPPVRVAMQGAVGQVREVKRYGWPEPLVIVDFGDGGIACYPRALEAA